MQNGKMYPKLVLLVFTSVLLASCSSEQNRAPAKNVVVPTLNERQVINLVMEEIPKQLPFGIEEFDGDQYEIEASFNENDGKWVVTFDHLPPKPGSYFFAILTPDGKVAFWHGK